MNVIKKGPGKQNPKNLPATVKRLLCYIGKKRWLVVLCMAVTLGGALLQVAAPKLLGNATTMLFQAAGQGLYDFGPLGKLLTGIGVLYAGVFITTFLQQRLMVVASQNVVYSLKKELKSKLNRLPLSFYDKYTTGGLMNIAMNDMENIGTQLQESLTQLLSSVITAVGVLAMMLYISPLLTALALVMLPGSVVVMKIFTGPTQKHNRQYLKEQGSLNGQIEETYQNFVIIKSFNGEKDALEKFDAVNESMYQSGWKARFFGGSMMPGMLFIQNIIYVGIGVAASIRVMNGIIAIGDMQAFLQYSTQFSNPLSRISMVWGNLLSAVVSAERIFEILDEEEQRKTMDDLDNIAPQGKVQFEHVSFGYGEKTVLADFCLTAQAGEMTAIVGHTGAGKTTLIQLLERFYEVRQGGIYIDGVDIRNMPYGQLRAKIGMVLQDTWLFSGTIYDNIRYGNQNATEDEVYAAAKAAFADDFIQKLPLGYNTFLTEGGSNLSQGQRQLITIARAFIANPEILVLDEATSNVDTRTEMVIQKALKKLMNGRTSFVIAHRLSTIYHADKIVVVKDGRIVETGTHQELIGRGGEYADIYNSQFAIQAA